jgi:hypothetical protein
MSLSFQSFLRLNMYDILQENSMICWCTENMTNENIFRAIINHENCLEYGINISESCVPFIAREGLISIKTWGESRWKVVSRNRISRSVGQDIPLYIKLRYLLPSSKWPPLDHINCSNDPVHILSTI